MSFRHLWVSPTLRVRSYPLKYFWCFIESILTDWGVLPSSCCIKVNKVFINDSQTGSGPWQPWLLYYHMPHRRRGPKFPEHKIYLSGCWFVRYCVYTFFIPPFPLSPNVSVVCGWTRSTSSSIGNSFTDNLLNKNFLMNTILVHCNLDGRII